MPSDSIALPSAPQAGRSSRTRSAVLWLAQILLAAAFLLAGDTHAFSPIAVAVA
jgi:hypothetical protein